MSSSNLDVITQEDILHLQELTEESRKRQRRLKTFKQTLIERLDRGATIQRGRFTLCLLQICAKVLSRAKLLKLLGEAECERLLELVEPTVHRRLQVSLRGPQVFPPEPPPPRVAKCGSGRPGSPVRSREV
jgi:hypothetical protein